MAAWRDNNQETFSSDEQRKKDVLYIVYPNLFMKLPFEDVTILTDASIMYNIQYYETEPKQNKKQSPLVSSKISLRQMSFTALPFLTPTLQSRAADFFLFYSYDHPKDKDNHEIFYAADG